MSQPEMKIDPDGIKRWFLNGKLHREDGPAIEWSNGTKEWWLNGKRHRSDGPAVERNKGSKEWWFCGKPVSWRDVFRQAKDPEIELRILLAALTIP
jgi:hypothetical protein